MTTSKKISSITLIAIIVCISLIHSSYFTNQCIPKIVLLSFSLFVFGAFPFFQKQWKFPKSKIALFWLSFLFLLGIVSLQKGNIYSKGERFYLWILLCFMHFVFSFCEKKTYRFLFFSFLLSACVASLYGIYQSFFTLRIHTYAAHSSTFGNVIFAASYMAIVLPMILGHKFHPILKYFSMACLLTYLIRTGARGPWLACILGFSIYFAFYIFFSWKKISWKKCLLSFSIILLLLSPCLYISHKFIQKRFQSIIEAKDSSFRTRELLWKSTWQMTKKHLFFGVGIGQFEHHFHKYRAPEEFTLTRDERLVDHPHQTFLLIFSESGIFSLLLFIGLLFSTIIGLLNIISTQEDLRPRAISMLSSLFVLGAIALTFCPLLSPSVALLLPFMTAWTQKHSKTNFWSISPKKRLHIVYGLIYISIISFSIFWSIRYFLSNVYLAKGQKLLLTRNFRQAEKKFRKSAKLYPIGIHYEEWGRSLLANARQAHMEDQIQMSKQKYNEAIQAFQKAIDKNPALKTSYVDKALCHLYLAEGKKALSLLEQAWKLFPASANVQRNLAILLTDLKHPYAQKHLKEWARLDPKTKKTAFYHFKLGEASESNPVQALKHYSKAKTINQNYVMAYIRLFELMKKHKREKFQRVFEVFQDLLEGEDFLKYINKGICYESLKTQRGYLKAISNYARAKEIESEEKRYIHTWTSWKIPILKSRSGAAHIHIACVMLKIEIFRAKATRHLSNAAKTDMKGPKALAFTEYAKLYTNSGQTSTAIFCYKRALALCPQFTFCHRKLGELLLETQEYQKAEKLFYKWSFLAPGEAYPYLYLAKTYFMMRRKKLAHEYFQKAYNLGFLYWKKLEKRKEFRELFRHMQSK